MKVLSVASEIYPLIKTGGLADVTGALPLAMATHGIETKTLIPGYPAVMRVIDAPMERVHLPDLLGVEARILESRYMGLDLLILDAPSLFDRDGGPYLDPAGRDYEDNWLRFAALSRAGADIAAGAMPGWRPDIVHAHDWQAAMTPVFMRYSEALEIPSVMTIHNIAFQGQFGSQIFPGLRLPPHAYSTQSIEYYGDINYLKGGIETCWAVTTVSPSYADEILTPEFGMGLEGVIAGRANALHGIVNGIDTMVWDPSNDGLVVSNYTVDTIKSRKPNREAVVAHFNLDSDPGPIFCVISRLTWQKGMDVLAETVDQIVAMGAKLIILGSGESALEAMLSEQAARYPGRVSISVGYNEGLSHLMQAGSDAILIPSRFEPCGLTQLYALRYGCVPVVARIGGLADTVIDANPAAISANAATGVQFSPVTAEGLLQGIRRTVRLHADQKLWTELQKQGMKSEVSWDGSAARYAALYSGLVSKGI